MTDSQATPSAPATPTINRPVQGEVSSTIPQGGATFDTINELLSSSNGAESGESVKTPTPESTSQPAKQVETKQEGGEVVQQKDQQKIEKAAETIKQTVTRKILGLDGDKPVELTPTAKFKHKVDGKEVEVSVQDLLDNYSGQTSWKQRFTELDKQKKAFEGETKVMKESLAALSKFVSEGKSFEALEQLCEMAGVDKIEFMKTYIDEADAISDQFSSMTEEQREAYFTKKQNEDLANKLKKKEETENLSKSQRQLKSEVDSMLSEAKISQEEFNSNLKFLVDEGVFKDDKQITPQQVAKAVIDYSGSVRRYEAASKAIEAVDPKALENKNLLDSLAHPTNTDLSHEELVEVVSRVLGKTETSTASASSAETSQEAKKAPEEKSKGSAKRASPEKVDSKKEEPEKEKKRPILWEDLE